MNRPDRQRSAAGATLGPRFETMVIVGVGLIGSSLARAVKQRGLASRIVGMGRGRPNLRKALELGVIDAMEGDFSRALRGAELVVLATPVESIPVLLRRIAPFCEEKTLLTDVGSVKAPIVRAAEKSLPFPECFVGGHPIAGTEHSGVEAGFPTLFEDRKTILTPTPRTAPEAFEQVRRLWEAVGSTVVSMDMEEHDRIMGFVSHLPHIVAYSLVHTIYTEDRKQGNLAHFSAGGFLDFTRIASSAPEMWRDICVMNREALLEAIEVFSKTLEEFRSLISAGDAKRLEEHFWVSRRTRAELLKAKAGK